MTQSHLAFYLSLSISSDKSFCYPHFYVAGLPCFTSWHHEPCNTNKCHIFNVVEHQFCNLLNSLGYDIRYILSKLRNLLPHFFPAGRFLMLQRLGIEIAIPGLIPAFLAKGDNKTAQRHLGALFINAPTLLQQAGGAFALPFFAAARHGLKLAAADPMGVFPHSPAPSTPLIKVFEATKTTNTATRHTFKLEAIFDNWASLLASKRNNTGRLSCSVAS